MSNVKNKKRSLLEELQQLSYQISKNKKLKSHNNYFLNFFKNIEDKKDKNGWNKLGMLKKYNCKQLKYKRQYRDKRFDL